MFNLISDAENYFRTKLPPRDPLLLEMEEEASKKAIPIVGPVVGELLFILARVCQAERILEIGTATGYSAIHMARGAEQRNGRVITLEREKSIASRAEDYFKKAGLEERIKVRVGDALKSMEIMEGPFDMIFLDFEKKNYAAALPHCTRLLRSGGLLVADNVAFVDADPFNTAIFDQPEWRVVELLSLLPLHSPETYGLCIALRV